MIQKGDIVDLTIEKLTYGGEGLGRIDNFAVFVPDTAPGDKVKAEVISVKKNFARAQLKEVVSPSEHRIKPFCPYANVCGGCQWQHIDYQEQLRAKKQIVQESLKQVIDPDFNVNDTIKSLETKEYRCKVQIPVQQTKVSKRFLAGYYRKGTHDIVNIKYCPVQHSLIDEITKFLREKAQELELTAYKECRKKGLIRHFVYRYSKTKNNLILTIVANCKKTPEKLVQLCQEAKQNFSQIAGVAVNFNTSHTNIILGRENEHIAGESYITEELDGKSFRISQDAFFQVNPHAAKEMFFKVKEIIDERTTSPDILDVYAGSGGFSLYLSDIANHIKAVEGSESSVADGKDNISKNNINNLEFINENAETALPKMIEEDKNFDVTVLDPPRKGCSEKVLEAVSKLTGKFLVYVSCNPATLARDMKFLSNDFKIKFVQPVDMFCHTYHVETLLLAEKIS